MAQSTTSDPWWVPALRHKWQAIHIIYVNSGSICAFIVCLWALIRGGRPERLAAATIAIGWILTDVFQAHLHRAKEIQVIAIDAIVFAIFLWLALKYRKSWTFYLAVCQFCGLAVRLTAHFIRFEFKSYITVVGIFSGWALLIALAAGVWGSEMRRRKELPLD